MKNHTLILSLFGLLSLFFLTGISETRVSFASDLTVAVEESSVDCQLPMFTPIPNAELTTMSRKEIEVQLGRRLSFRDRTALRMVRRHEKRMENLNADDEICSDLIKKASNSILFGLLGLLIAGIIFGVLAISAGSKAVNMADENPDCLDADRMRRKGSIGMLLGMIDIIGGVLFILLLL